MAAPRLLGPGKISAALLGAPTAALLASLALCGALPLPDDVRLFLFAFVGLTAIAAAPCLALLAKNGSRAWIAAAAVAVPSTFLLVFT